MQTLEAIYEEGKIIFPVDPKIKKAKVLVTFLDGGVEEKKRIKFPTGNLGKVKNIKGDNLYDQYLSDRH